MNHWCSEADTSLQWQFPLIEHVLSGSINREKCLAHASADHQPGLLSLLNPVFLHTSVELPRSVLRQRACQLLSAAESSPVPTPSSPPLSFIKIGVSAGTGVSSPMSFCMTPTELPLLFFLRKHTKYVKTCQWEQTSHKIPYIMN